MSVDTEAIVIATSVVPCSKLLLLLVSRARCAAAAAAVAVEDMTELEQTWWQAHVVEIDVERSFWTTHDANSVPTRTLHEGTLDGCGQVLVTTLGEPSQSIWIWVGEAVPAAVHE